MALMMGRKSIASSGIGGLRETQECIDFCNKHNVVPEYKLITYDQLPQVYDTLNGKNDSIIRYVLDIGKSSSEE